MIPETVKTALNRQIRDEFGAAQTYLSAATALGVRGFPGHQHWYWKQYEEELSHAHKLINYMVDRDVQPSLLFPEARHFTQASSPLNIAEHSLGAERVMSAQIDELYRIAHQEGDYKTVAMLQWFLEEQVEEERLFTDLVDATKRVDGHGPGLEYLDREMGKRE